MAAVPIYVWNGTAWQETGPTIPANPIKYQASAPSSPSTGDIWVDSDGDVTTGSQQFQRFRFVASGGETTISGADANGAVLAYTAGLEQVVLNGAVLVRGHDYTATTGTTITGLSPALVASDVLEVFSFIAFSVANTYTQSQVDGLLADYAGLRLIVPTSATNGTVGATGAVTFSGVSSVSLNGVFSSTYDNYRIIMDVVPSSNSAVNLRMRMRQSSDLTDSTYNNTGVGNSTSASDTLGYTRSGTNQSYWNLSTLPDARRGYYSIDIYSPFLTTSATYFNGQSILNNAAQNSTGGVYSGTTGGVDNSITAFSIFCAAGNIAGTIRVYGYKN
jgi:hypothetical protein